MLWLWITQMYVLMGKQISALYSTVPVMDGRNTLDPTQTESIAKYIITHHNNKELLKTLTY